VPLIATIAGFPAVPTALNTPLFVIVDYLLPINAEF
jgi:hypothetical protein